MKTELECLKDALNIYGEVGNHHPCPFHDDSNGSLSIYFDGQSWKWKCHAGCGGGGLLEALQRTGGSCDMKFAKSEAQIVSKWPIPNSHNLSVHSCRPGISCDNIPVEVVQRNLSPEVLNHFGVKLYCGLFSIPISDPEGDIVAIKIHKHQAEPGRLKCYWSPIGTAPIEKPKHGVATLFPRPEIWNKLLKLYICPGELKALRLVSMGHQAVSPTSGESFRWPEDEVDRLQGFRTTVIYDNDEAGIKFRDKTMAAMLRAGIPCQATHC